MNRWSFRIKNDFKINRETAILALVCFYGIYAHIAGIFSVDLPVKPVIILLSVFLLVVSAFSSSSSDQIKCIVGVSFLGIELVMFLIPFIYFPMLVNYFLIRKKGFTFKKWSIIFLVFFLLAVVQLVLSNLSDFSFYTILFWFIIFGFGGLFFIYYTEKNYTEEQVLDIFSYFKKLILLQIPVLFVQSLIHRKFFPGDDWNGTFLDADKTGFYLLLLLLFYITPILFMKNVSYIKIVSVKRTLYFSVLVVFLIFCDSKIKNVLVFSGLFVISAFCLFPAIINRSLVVYRKALFFFLLFIFSTGFIFSIMNFYLHYISKSQITIQATVGNYSYAPDPNKVRYGINAKYLLYKKVYIDLLYDFPRQWFFGTGPGKFGSRTSNMLAYDMLYKEKGQFRLPEFIPSYSSSLVKRYMRKIWTAEQGAFTRHISSNLSIPFAGWITIKGEMGVIGVIIYLMIAFLTCVFLLKKGFLLVNPVLKSWALVLSIFWISLPLQMLIDNIQEKPQIMFPMYLLTAIVLGITIPSSAIVEKE